MVWEEGELQGKDSQPPTGLPLPWAGCLPLCLCLLLLVSHPWQHSDGESSWWRETLSIATKHVCPPPSVALMQSVHTSVKGIGVVLTGKQKPNIRSRLHSLFYAVFSNHRMTEWVACMLQALQNSRFPWHMAWALWHLAQTLACMEKGHPQEYLEILFVKRVLNGSWQFVIKTLRIHNN